jgi:DNA polymerase-4
MGVTCCGDLQAFSQFELVEQFGSFGQRLYQLCRGLDERQVKPSRRRKSLSVENTFGSNLQSLEACRQQLPALIKELERRLGGLLPACRVARAVVKVKFADFTQTTAEATASGIDHGQLRALCDVAWSRRNQPVRLLGVGVRFLHAAGDSEQLELFTEATGA